MTTVAAYVDVRDGSTTLSQPGDPTQTLATFDANGQLLNPRPVLSFRVDPSLPAASTSVNLTMKLNNQVIVNQDFVQGFPRAWIEVIDQGILESTDNELVAELHAPGGNGDAAAGSSISVSDIALMFSVNV